MHGPMKVKFIILFLDIYFSHSRRRFEVQILHFL